jgi:hypothetical protein
MSQPTREVEQRLATLRQRLERNGRLDVDVSGLPADLEAAWITTHVRGEPTDSCVLDAIERGYRTATHSVIPTVRMPDIQGRAMDASTPIRRNDTQLMVREKVLGDYERKFIRDQGQNALHQASREVETLESGSSERLNNRYIQPRAGNKLHVSTSGPPQSAIQD